MLNNKTTIYRCEQGRTPVEHPYYLPSLILTGSFAYSFAGSFVVNYVLEGSYDFYPNPPYASWMLGYELVIIYIINAYLRI